MAETATQTTEVKVKKKKGKKALIVLGIVVGVIAVAAGVCAIISAIGSSGNLKFAKAFDAVDYTAQLAPEKDADGDWCFTTDKDFKVVQLTDVHLGGGFLSLEKDSSAIQAVASMLKAEQPDLVIVTGDVAYPVPFQSGTFNNKTGAKLFANLMETLGVYWTLGFGNHDTEAYSYFTREDIYGFYASGDFPHCLLQAGPDDVDGVGNQVVKVRNSDGLITQAFVVLDSHSYTGGDFLGILWKYDNLHQNQIDWYRERINAMSEENAEILAKMTDKKKAEELKDLATVKSLLFFHIPLPEYKDAWDELAANGYEDTANVQYITGLVGETGKCIYSGIGEDQMFETIQELGSTKAVFCGHDHYNNFSVRYHGIELVYGNSVDYLAYVGINKKGSQRGCTVITTGPDGSYQVDKYNLYTSGRYDYPAEFAKDVAMQFEDVTFQYIEPEK